MDPLGLTDIHEVLHASLEASDDSSTNGVTQVNSQQDLLSSLSLQRFEACMDVCGRT